MLNPHHVSRGVSPRDATTVLVERGAWNSELPWSPINWRVTPGAEDPESKFGPRVLNERKR